MRLSTLTAALNVFVLSGCVAPYYGDFRTDYAVNAAVVRREYANPAALAYDCVRTFGVLTGDHRACLVHRWGVCWYLTRVGDREHDRELMARCNGWGLSLKVG